MILMVMVMMMRLCDSQLSFKPVCGQWFELTINVFGHNIMTRISIPIQTKVPISSVKTTLNLMKYKMTNEATIKLLQWETIERSLLYEHMIWEDVRHTI